MSQQNPRIESPPPPHPDEALKPSSPDFREMPSVAPLSEVREPVPLWLYLVCGCILFLVGSSFTGFDTFGLGMLDQGPGAPAIPRASATAQAATLTPIQKGEKVYNDNCSNCHQKTGMGQPGSYPPLAGSEWVLGSKERLAAILLKGVQGSITVKGASFSTQAMPAQESVLTPDKLANLMTYLRGAWGNTAGPVSVDEVNAAKTKFASHSGPWSEADLLKIAPHGSDPTDTKP